MAKADLRRVTRAAKRRGDAEAEFTAALVAASNSGETLRDIAHAAGVSHQTVHNIVRQAKAGK